MTRDQFRGCGKRRSGGSSSCFPPFSPSSDMSPIGKRGEMGGRDQIAGEEERKEG